MVVVATGGLINGFRKTGVCPFNSSVPESDVSSDSSTLSASFEDSLDEHNNSTATNADQTVPSSPELFLSEEKLALFEHRYENGYNLYSATGFESKMACFWCFWLVFCELQVVAG